MLGVRKQKSDQVRMANALRVHECGEQVPILVARAGSSEAWNALAHAFELHRAPVLDLETGIPDLALATGICMIGRHGVQVTLQGAGTSLASVQMQVTWGPTSPAWRGAALSEGCVWLGLLREEAYQGAYRTDPPRLPLMPVLRLDVRAE